MNQEVVWYEVSAFGFGVYFKTRERQEVVDYVIKFKPSKPDLRVEKFSIQDITSEFL